MQGQRPFVPPISKKWNSWWVGISQNQMLQKNVVDAMFFYIDKDRSGTISFKESKTVFRDFGFGENSVSDLHKCFKAFDQNGTGDLHYDEFFRMMQNFINSTVQNMNK
mmetsp:Transcript_104728/g.225978  ORF Transcript_104728/g.225978 Transcript_104728/m.225978 type:complete len:108 (-) Transcript_104728:168-491(-)